MTCDELYHQMLQIAAAMMGATNHIQSVYVSADVYGADVSRIECALLSHSKVIVISPDIDHRLAFFLDGKFTSRKVAREKQEFWDLGMVKSDLALILSRIICGMGPTDPVLMAAEWNSYWQYPHGMVWTEGISTYASGLFLDDFIRALGFDRLDPRILSVPPARQYFVAQSRAIQAIVEDIAKATGMEAREEVRKLAQDGSGQLALWELAARWALVYAHGDIAQIPHSGVLTVLRKAIEKPMGALKEDWMEYKQKPIGLGEDEDMGEMWGHAVAHDITKAMRRISMDKNGLVDTGYLGAQLSDAARTALDELVKGAHALNHAMEMLEMGDG